MAKRIDEQSFSEEVIKSSLPVLVEFYSDSCIPCKQLSPVLASLEEQFTGQIRVVKVNVNYEANLAQTYQIMASPTILFFKEGKEWDRVQGVMKKDALEEKIEVVLNIRRTEEWLSQ